MQETVFESGVFTLSALKNCPGCVCSLRGLTERLKKRQPVTLYRFLNPLRINTAANFEIANKGLKKKKRNDGYCCVLCSLWSSICARKRTQKDFSLYLPATLMAIFISHILFAHVVFDIISRFFKGPPEVPKRFWKKSLKITYESLLENLF